ncbi:hypothetical protein [Helicobacter sp. WB40]|uniref:hypothetical protein n=1 Tax=Helicobacter sp. WB40 TaxID=3004130 RepID=UPI0022EBDC60|nr:hypothetical protein [Helicobacter sp. WB40]MDA3967455.1 hypothetical protein [Helicobacter sp. WB40]
MQNNLSNDDIIALASSYMSYANLFIVIATLIIAFITICLTIYYNRDKKRIINETTRNILNKIADDEQMRNTFVEKILENEDFKQEFERMVDIHISDKMGRLVDENKEKSSIGGLK